MKNLKVVFNLTISDSETNEILIQNNTISEGSNQTIIHSLKNIMGALTYSIDIAQSQMLLEKQKEENKK